MTKSNKKAVDEKAVDEKAVDEKAVDEKTAVLEATEKQVADFLSSHNVKAEQSIDHLKAYREALQVCQSNKITVDELTDNLLTDDQKGFELVQSWFKRSFSLSELFAIGQVNLDSASRIDHDKNTMIESKYKKVTGSNAAKLRTFIRTLTPETVEQLTADECRSLLKWSAVYSQLQPKTEGVKKKRLNGFKVELINSDKRPDFKGDRNDFLTVVDSVIENGAVTHKQAAEKYHELRAKRGTVGKSTYEQQYSKMKSVLRDEGYCTIVDIDV